MRPAILAAVIAAMATAATAAERLPSFPKNTSYQEARRSLIGLGYKPVTMPDADKCYAGDERCQGRPEMSSCSGTGMAYCNFTWRPPRDMLIEITTVGEGINKVHAISCRANCK